MKLKDFGYLSEAERRVRDEIHSGNDVRVGTGALPTEKNDSNRIRATFLRYLALGGCEACRPGPKGVRIQGAWIDGNTAGEETKGLDLEGCTLKGDLGLIYCKIPDTLLLRRARFKLLNLSGSHLDGEMGAEGKTALDGDGLKAEGGVFLRGVTAKGGIRLLGAEIGGNLDCVGAELEAEGGDALHADGAQVTGGVFLSEVTAKGGIRLLGAEIGGGLSCIGADLEAEGGNALHADGAKVTGGVFLRGVTAKGGIRLPGGEIGGNLECDGADLEAKGGVALNADGARVTGSLILRKGKRSVRIVGRLDLTDAEVGALVDEAAAWPAAGELVLDRFRYGAITGGPVTARARLEWLALQDPGRFGQDFWPQPYEQLAKVFREMGHRADARDVQIEKERLQRKAAQEKLRAALNGAKTRLAWDKIAARPLSPANEKAVSQNAEIADNVEAGIAPPEIREHVEEWARAYPIAQYRRKARAAALAENPELSARLASAERVIGSGPRRQSSSVARGRVNLFWWRLLWARAMDALLRSVIGYGWKPYRAFYWLAGLWMFGAVLYGVAWGEGAFKPNNAFVLRAPEWVLCAVPAGEKVMMAGARHKSSGFLLPEHGSQLACFLERREAGSYPEFQSAIYSADVLFPLVSLELQEYWLPDEAHSPRGWFARIVHWVQIIAGWGLTLLAVAGFSGLVRSD